MKKSHLKFLYLVLCFAAPLGATDILTMFDPSSQKNPHKGYEPAGKDRLWEGYAFQKEGYANVLAEIEKFLQDLSRDVPKIEEKKSVVTSPLSDIELLFREANALPLSITLERETFADSMKVAKASHAASVAVSEMLKNNSVKDILRSPQAYFSLFQQLKKENSPELSKLSEALKGGSGANADILQIEAAALMIGGSALLIKPLRGKLDDLTGEFIDKFSKNDLGEFTKEEQEETTDALRQLAEKHMKAFFEKNNTDHRIVKAISKKLAEDDFDFFDLDPLRDELSAISTRDGNRRLADYLNANPQLVSRILFSNELPDAIETEIHALDVDDRREVISLIREAKESFERLDSLGVTKEAFFAEGKTVAQYKSSVDKVTGELANFDKKNPNFKETAEQSKKLEARLADLKSQEKKIEATQIKRDYKAFSELLSKQTEADQKILSKARNDLDLADQSVAKITAELEKAILAKKIADKDFVDSLSKIDEAGLKKQLTVLDRTIKTKEEALNVAEKKLQKAQEKLEDKPNDLVSQNLVREALEARDNAQKNLDNVKSEKARIENTLKAISDVRNNTLSEKIELLRTQLKEAIAKGDKALGTFNKMIAAIQCSPKNVQAMDDATFQDFAKSVLDEKNFSAQLKLLPPAMQMQFITAFEAKANALKLDKEAQSEFNKIKAQFRKVSANLMANYFKDLTVESINNMTPEQTEELKSFSKTAAFFDGLATLRGFGAQGVASKEYLAIFNSGAAAALKKKISLTDDNAFGMKVGASVNALKAIKA